MSIVIGHATAKGVDHRFAFFQEIIASLTVLGDLPRERCHGLSATHAGESGIIRHGLEHEPVRGVSTQPIAILGLVSNDSSGSSRSLARLPAVSGCGKPDRTSRLDEGLLGSRPRAIILQDCGFFASWLDRGGRSSFE